MANLSVTSADITAATGATLTTKRGTAGAAITAGDAIYIDTANSDVLKVATCEGTYLEATVAGIALNDASVGQPVEYVTRGRINWTASEVVAGGVYILSTAGLLCPAADATTGDYVTLVGVGYAANVLDVCTQADYRLRSNTEKL